MSRFSKYDDAWGSADDSTRVDSGATSRLTAAMRARFSAGGAADAQPRAGKLSVAVLTAVDRLNEWLVTPAGRGVTATVALTIAWLLS
jgi:hypothetical protein